MAERTDLLDILKFISPAQLDYQEWVNVGMALKHEGYPCSTWDSWSMADSRYHAGECSGKWGTFRGSGEPVTAGTIVQMAMDMGWKPEIEEGHELSWDDELVKEEHVVVDKNWIEDREVVEPAPSGWNPAKELITYIETLFDSTENVGFVTKSFEKDGKYMPTKGCFDRNAGQLIQLLNHKKDIRDVVGDYNELCGAWIRFNPLDGKDCKNENVTDFRYALVESDTIEIGKQNAIIRELELPVACMVHSGGKSLHAIVKIEAADYSEYRKRVDYLYNICNKNGFKIDKQNRNPSRLSRMPGIMRNGKKQFIVDTNIGRESWDEWYEWIESINDDLPEPEPLEEVWDHLPELSPALIENVLRQGHKMLIAGPSKAGKSFALIELCIAIAEGRKWMDWQCTKGKIMYVNLELDRASCLHRFKDVYERLGWKPEHLSNLDIWNLRGKSVPLDKLAPKLIRRAQKKNYIAIVIDPIYKVITGDENSADQMAAFCNQFDKICTELGTAVIYCHHHSKGAQGGKKSMDRASGSGVFARDPDALLDLIELEVNTDIQNNLENNSICDACAAYLNQVSDDWEDEVSQDDLCSSYQMLRYCEKKLTAAQYKELNAKVCEVSKNVKNVSAWRIEGTLREFAKFSPVNMWFDYPTHVIDRVGILKDIQAEQQQRPRYGGDKKNLKKKKTAEELKEERKQAIETAFDARNMDGEVTLKDIAEYTGKSEDTVRRHLKEHGGFWIDEGKVGRKSPTK